MITGESRAVAKEPGDEGRGRHGRRRRQPARPGHRGRRRDGPVGDHAHGRGGAGLRVAGPGARRPGGRAAVLRRPRRRACVTLGVWWLDGDPEEALVRTATVLVIACPHALGLAIPLVIAISTSLGARNGLLVKDRMALERARELEWSSSTRPARSPGASRPVGWRAEGGRRGRAPRAWPPRSRPTRSTRSRGRSWRGARAREHRAGAAPGSRPLAGRGARATVDGREVAVGGPRLLGAEAELRRRSADERGLGGEGRTVLHVVADGGSSAPWRSRTRSGPSRPRRSSGSTRWACGWP